MQQMDLKCVLVECLLHEGKSVLTIRAPSRGNLIICRRKMWKNTTTGLLLLVLWTTFAITSIANTEIINFKTTHHAGASQDLAIEKDSGQIV
jgi:hypothetical protein